MARCKHINITSHQVYCRNLKSGVPCNSCWPAKCTDIKTMDICDLCETIIIQSPQQSYKAFRKSLGI